MAMVRTVKSQLAGIRLTCFRSIMLLGASVALVWSPGAVAQEGAAGDEPIEAIVVTGTRIERTGMDTETPVTVMTNEDVELLGPGTLMDGLQYIPQLQSNTRVDGVNANTWRSTAGQSAVNIRGVGRARTLVLIDGRRVVPSNHLGFVDINQVPRALMRRVEVVTGGASAAYGSDAVAGVMNFILDTDYTGFRASVQGGRSYLGDADNQRAEISSGFRIGDRSHLALAAEYYTIDGVPNLFGRDWYRNRGYLNRGEDTGILPQRVRVENLCSRDYTFGGLITRGPLAGTQFLEDGTPAPFPDHQPMDERALSGLENGIIRGEQVDPSCDDLDLHEALRSAEDRGSLFARWTYDLNDNTRLSLQGIYGYNKITSQRGPYTFSNNREVITIFQDNAFLPEEIRQEMMDNDIPSFVLSKEIPQSDPMNNAGLGGAPVTGRTASWTAAIDGDLGDDWRYTAYYQFGRSNRYLEAHGYRYDRMWRGLDAVVHPDTGEIVCRSTLFEPDDGCVPINFFGLGNELPEARDYVHGYMWSDSTVKQHVGEFAINGKVHDGWGSGPIFGAVGVGARKESIAQVGGDPTGTPGVPIEAPRTVSDGGPLYRGLPGGVLGSNVINRADAPTFSGDYNVWEVFAETLFPIVQGQPLARDMTLNLAARYADYSGSGGMWAWKAGLDWQIVEDLRFRMTRSRDVRAANLNERFNTTLETTRLPDPERDDAQTVIDVISGGNPEVDPEASDTLTMGLVYRPSWLEGLSTSLDFFDLDIGNAITFIGERRIVQDCSELGTFCDLIERDPPGPGEEFGPITTVRDQFVNVQAFRARGMDLEVSYRPSFRPLDGVLMTRMLLSHMNEASFNRPGGIVIERAGTGFVPEWSGTLSLIWVRDPLVLSWSERFRDGVVTQLTWVEGIDADKNDIEFQNVSSLRATYNFDRSDSVFSVYGAVTNVFNKNPGDADELSNIYRDIGRTYTLGFRYEFGEDAGPRRRPPRR